MKLPKMPTEAEIRDYVAGMDAAALAAFNSELTALRRSVNEAQRYVAPILSRAEEVAAMQRKADKMTDGEKQAMATVLGVGSIASGERVSVPGAA